ncbi:MAG: hypothetical protein NTV11_07175 [Rhodocyclales bacterium]|nr:hypothetical protein [Rhodocyclales bacterium]
MKIIIIGITGIFLSIVWLLAWLSGPSIGRTAIWLLIALAIAYLAGRKATDKQSRRITQVAVMALLFIFPFAIHVTNDISSLKPTALNVQCSEVSKTSMAIQPKAPTPTDGFLVAMDYDGISNFRRIKNIPSHPGLDILHASTFDEMAQIALLNWKYSFIEFEMKPRSMTDPMFPGEYSNTGHLDAKGWSGDRYRLYYLAPRGHSNCIQKLNFNSVPVRSDQGAPSAAPVAVLAGGQITMLNEPPAQPEFCLALEITTTPISKYKLVATDTPVSMPAALKIQGFDFYTFADARSDTVEVIGSDPSKPLAKYDGFHAIVDGKSVSNCGNSAGVKNLLALSLTPDHGRSFYKTKDWYADSAVQRYFEGSQDETKPIREPFADRFKKRDPSTPVTYEGTRCPEYRTISLEDMAARWSEYGGRTRDCTHVEAIKVTCEYIKGRGVRETWTYEACGRTVKQVNTTGYDPSLHGERDMASLPDYKEKDDAAR